MEHQKWKRTNDSKPPENWPVHTKIDDGVSVRNTQVLMYRDNMWWSGDTYVYYAPTHWRFGAKTNEI